MNILIADDQAMACQYLSNIIKSLPGCHDVGHAANGIEAVYKTYDLDIDVILMDVRMPRMSGLEAARHIVEFDNPPAAVFTTAYAEHALDAFGVQACGFLPKPVHPAKMVEVLDDLNRNRISKKKVEEPAVFDNSENYYVCCRIRGGLNLIAMNQVLYLKTEDKCTVIRHLLGSSISDQPLKVFEDQLGNRLIRVRRGLLVNRAYVDGLKQDKNGVYSVMLRGIDEKLQVSRRSLAPIRKHLSTFLKPRAVIRHREMFLVQNEYNRR